APLEQIATCNDAVFHYFVQPGTKLAARQRGQQLRIDDDGGRQMKGADEILSQWMVDARFAADRAVNLREQRGRHLHDRNSTQVSGRREPGDVAGYAATNRHNGTRSIGTRTDERVVDSSNRCQLF